MSTNSLPNDMNLDNFELRLKSFVENNELRLESFIELLKDTKLFFLQLSNRCRIFAHNIDYILDKIRYKNNVEQ